VIAATLGQGKRSSRSSTACASRIDGTASAGVRTWPNSLTSAPAMNPLLAETMTSPDGLACSISARRSFSSSIAARDSAFAL
jgi:hypothetical protein